MKFTITKMNSFSFNMVDDCLAIVFDLLPLEDLLHCNLVCHQWNRLYRAACARRRKLTLIIGNPENKTPYQFVFNSAFNSHPFANWDDKQSPIRHSWLMRMNTKFDHRLVTGLMHNLANITTLEIICYIRFNELENISQLLHFWAEKLVSLKFWPSFDYRIYAMMDSMQLRLIDTINSLSRLTHLTIGLYTKSLYTKDSNNEPIMRIQLENLKEFYLSNASKPDDGCKAIQRYAQSHPNLRVGFNVGFRNYEHMELLFSYDHQVASRVTQLSLQSNVTEPLLTRVCGHFSNLTTLQFTSSILPAAEWTKAIAQCSQLVHLRLDLQMKVDECPDLRTRPTKAQITQLKCIKMLSIKLFSYSHDDLKIFQLTWIFPCLEMFYIIDDIMDCNICGNYFDYFECDTTMRFDQCHKLLLSPLKEFEHLKVVRYFNWINGDVLYPKEDL